MFNENSGIVRVWVNLIEDGKRTLAEVPELSNLKTVVGQVLASS